MVCRSSLLERLARGDAGPIVSVVAPPGYGKTTLLSQWASVTVRPLRVARLRAEGKMIEIGPHDLSLTPGEATDGFPLVP